MVKQIRITLPDGTSQKFPSGTTALAVAEALGPRLARAALAAEINGKPADLGIRLTRDTSVRILTASDEKGLEILRHSCAHLLAHAVHHLFPKALPTIGPAIEHGFYYDFDNLQIKEEDLASIEKEMWNIVKEGHSIERIEYKDKAAARKDYAKNKYKLELISESSEKLSAYREGDFLDLCRGPHVPNTKVFASFKLIKLAGAYWHGDAKREQLTRIYGLCFATKKELDAHLKILEQAELRNHRRIGEEMELFTHFTPVGKGLPIWLPKGETIRREVEKLAIEMEEERGYQRVATPHLAKKELFLTSGHLPYYAESMYPAMQMDDGTYYLKAMNCPFHHLIYGMKVRSYRELPLRLAEYGTCYRNELSGTLNGLLRVRMLSMNDAHIYCRRTQIASEVQEVLSLIKQYFSIFGLTEYWFRLSLGDRKNRKKYIHEPTNWRTTEDVLRSVLRKLKLPFTEAPDEAAFYGPKIDVQFRNVYGREETMSTIQLDFAAKSRFKLSYVDEKGLKNGEVFVIHRAPLSTHERFIAVLIEHYGGKFPFWLSPEQARVITIADRQAGYARDVAAAMKKAGLRVTVDERAETTSKKVREAQLAHVNYILVIGDKELADGTVSVRTRDNIVHGAKPYGQLIKELQELARNRQ